MMMQSHSSSSTSQTKHKQPSSSRSNLMLVGLDEESTLIHQQELPSPYRSPQPSITTPTIVTPTTSTVRKFPQLSIDTSHAQKLIITSTHKQSSSPPENSHYHTQTNNLNNNHQILNESDTPVPTPPPPPNSFKLPLHHHHQHYEYPVIVDDVDISDHDSVHSVQGSSTAVFSHPHHHHHHHGCAIHSQSINTSGNHHHHHHHHKKRRHRDSKRRRFRFSFRTKNSVAVSLETIPAPPLSTTTTNLHQNHHHLPENQSRAYSISSSTSDPTSCNSNLLVTQQSHSQHQQSHQKTIDLHSKKPNGGLKSKKLKTLVHPLDRSIVGIFLLTIFFTILALLTGAPTVLFLMILLPIFIFIKKIFQCTLFEKINNQEPVSSIDSFWLQKGHITHCLMYLDKGLSVQQLRDVIATRLLTKPELARFKSRLIHRGLCGSPYWKYEPELNNFDDHVIEDEPIDCKRSLHKRLMTFMGQSLPMDKPLWQIRYSLASYCDQVILIVRVHQTLSQSGLVSILTHYLCDSVPMCSTQKARFGSATLSINILRAIIVGPLTFFLWIMWAFTRRHHNYLTKAKEIKSIHWSALDLPKIYRIKQVTRSTLNDVLLACIAGSIRSYLTTKTNIINPPDLTVSIPVDIKPQTPIESSLTGVNYVLTSSPIPTNTEGAIPRLWEVRHLMEELKTSADTAVMYGSHYLLSRFLPQCLYRVLMNLVNRNSSVYMSNMTGPETALSIGSHRLNKVFYFLSPPSYCSLVYNIFSYDQKLHISISTSSKLITNSKELMRHFRGQIDTLHELLSKRRVPGESKRAKRPTFLGDQLAAQQQQLYGNQPATSLIEVSSAGGSVDLSDKLHEIQDELNQLSGAYEMGDPAVVQRYEELKEEFTTILYEMRRRKSLADYGHASNIVINIENQDDDDNDGELRAIASRRFSVVSLGRRASIVSSLPTTSRVTPPILSRRSMATSPEPPSSPEVAFKVETEC
uniref:Uncharacterized protein LOC113796046 n=1 Tax=Dermatophagoides pteronyssinus TaxID=6956 RepID=A0A6P6Y9N7_DERPT|nr:uncharacterized protein LOC113796046 [Dermatophagoides pteronyssinus]